MLQDFILPGAFIGLVAALSPGPMMALLIGETLKTGKWAGIKVAISPLFTDIPFIIIAMGVSKAIELIPGMLGIISIAGGCFLVYLAFLNIHVETKAFDRQAGTSLPLLKGMMVNLLNPFPYILWFSIALPIFGRGNTVGSIAFAASLLLTAPAVMIVLALLTDLLRKRFTSYLHWIVRVLGFLLLAYALRMIWAGIGMIFFVS